jgi:putative membrane protein
MTSLITSALVAAVLAPPITAEPKPTNDAEFVTACAQACNMQIQVNKLAYRQAEDKRVRELADQLVKAHNKMADDMAKRAKNLKVAVLADLSKAQEAEYNRLAELKGPEFDRAYLKWVVDSHQRGLAMCESYGSSDTAGELKQCATDCSSAWKDHLTQARNLIEALKAS